MEHCSNQGFEEDDFRANKPPSTNAKPHGSNEGLGEHVEPYQAVSNDVEEQEFLVVSAEKSTDDSFCASEMVGKELPVCSFTHIKCLVYFIYVRFPLLFSKIYINLYIMFIILLYRNKT